jgi:hypothetical protein
MNQDGDRPRVEEQSSLKAEEIWIKEDGGEGVEVRMMFSTSVHQQAVTSSKESIKNQLFK